MSASEFEETTFRLLQAEPFVPFGVELTAGRFFTSSNLNSSPRAEREPRSGPATAP
jgi:hypothetical protein